MKKITLVLFACLSVLLIMTSCTDNATLSDKENLMIKTEADENLSYNFVNGETTAPNSYTSYKNSADNFAFTILKNFYSSKKNTAFSSAGLYSQLCLLQNGAEKDTLKEIKQLTGKNISLDNLNSCNGYFFSRLESLNGSSKGHYIDIDSSIFFNQSITVGHEFLLKNADFYNQGIFRLDFSNENSLSKINSYISFQTKDKVSNMLNTLNENDGIYLTNTSFFKDKWLEGYTNENITTDTFKGSNGDEKTNFMISTEYYLKGKNCTGFIKDFKDTPSRFIALMPKENTNINKFIDGLDSDEYNDILDSMNVFSTCKTYLPEFSAKETISFSDVLSKAGAKNMFTSEGDFSGLSYGTKTSVADIVQSFELNITQAGAGTENIHTSDSTKKEAEHQVKLTRPFLYIIADNESNIPIYIGIISNI